MLKWTPIQQLQNFHWFFFQLNLLLTIKQNITKVQRFTLQPKNDSHLQNGLTYFTADVLSSSQSWQWISVFSLESTSGPATLLHIFQINVEKHWLARENSCAILLPSGGQLTYTTRCRFVQNDFLLSLHPTLPYSTSPRPTYLTQLSYLFASFSKSLFFLSLLFTFDALRKALLSRLARAWRTTKASAA